MSLIQALRQQYPQYKDYSDEELTSFLTYQPPPVAAAAEPAPAEDDSWQATKGLKAGFKQTGALGYGLLGMAGDLVGSEDLRQYGVEGYQRKMQEAQEYAPDVEGFTDIEGVGDALSWAGYTLGNLAPTMATALAGGGIGGLIGKKVAQTAATRLMAEQIGQGVSREVAAKAAGEFIAKRIAAGQGLGAYAASAGMETGSIYGETGDAGVSAVHGAVAGAFDALPIARVLGKYGLNRAAKAQVQKSVAREIATQGGIEAGTEALQTLVEQHAKHWVDTQGESLLGNLGEANWKEIIDAAAAGALGGGVMGGATGLLTRKPLEDAQARIEKAGEDAAAAGGDLLDQEIAKAHAATTEIPAATVEEQQQKQTRAERMAGIDGLIITAERMNFTDEAVLLRRAKQLFQQAEAARAQGNHDMASRFVERGNRLYRDATETQAPLRAESANYPVPYTFDGQISGGELATTRPPPNFTMPPEDIAGQATEIPTPQTALPGSTTAQLPPGTGQINMGRDRPPRTFTPVGPVTEGIGRNIAERQSPTTPGLPPGNAARTITPERYRALQDVRKTGLRTKLRERTPQQVEAIQTVAAVQAGEIEVTEAAPNIAAGAPDIAGAPIDNEWTAFAPESGTLNVPRADMPQVKADHRGALVNYLNARGIEHEQAEIDPRTLKATQREFSPAKVQKAREYEGGERSILVSSDGHVVDGHHQWLAKRDTGAPMNVIQLQAPIRDLVPLLHDFPSSEVDGGATSPATAPVEVSETLIGETQADLSRTGEPQIHLRPNGKPYRSETGARSSQVYRDNEGLAEVVPHGKGFAVQVLGSNQDDTAPASTDTKSKQATKQHHREPDPERDDLLTAIALGGGIRRSETEGVDPTDFQRRVGIRYLFPKNGGKTLDQMAEYLAQYGYVEGVNRTFDLQDKLDRALRGERVMTQEGEIRQLEQELLEDLPDDWNALNAQLASDYTLGGPFQPSQLMAEWVNRAQAAGVSDTEIQDIVDWVAPESEAIAQLQEKINAKETREEPQAGDGAGAVAEAARQEEEPGAAAEGSADAEGAAGGTSGFLSSYTEADLQAQDDTRAAEDKRRRDEAAAAEQKAQADAEADDFRLSGSDRPADVATAGGQGDIFGAAGGQSAPPLSARLSTAQSGPDLVAILRDIAPRSYAPLIDRLADHPLTQSVTVEHGGAVGEADYLMNGIPRNRQVDTHRIRIGDSLATADPAFVAEALAHELTHAVTYAAIDQDAQTLAGVPYLEHVQLRKDLDRIRKVLESADTSALSERARVSVQQMVGDIREVVTYGMTNPEVQELLQRLPSNRSDSIWTDFVNAVRRALGISEQGASLLDDVISATDSAMTLTGESAFAQSNGRRTTEAPQAPDETATDEPVADQATEPELADKQETAPAEIEDFGEKLGGARKDELRDVRERLADMDDEAIAASTLSKLWPKGEIDKIDDPVSAAIYQAARDEIPNKPRVAYKLTRWVGSVKQARELLQIVDQIGAGDRFIQRLREAGPGLNQFADKVELLASLDRAQWNRIGRVSRQSGRYAVGNGEMVPGSWYVVEIDGRREHFYGADAVTDAIPGVKEKLGAEQQEQRMKFEIRRNRSTGLVFINKKGDNEYRPLKEFDDLKAARDYLRENHDDLVDAWESVKNRDNVTKADMRRKTNSERVGADYRNGEDVTPDQFLQTFGFRGVEFGNWVKQGKGGKERQGMLNDAFDALMDLATVLDIPPKAISLDGKLGIGFGSRGSGSASAHFEPDMAVINLTKTRGAGSLAHEWFHALDNYFALKRGGAEFKGDQKAYREQSFITYRPEPMLVYKKGNTRYKLTRAEVERRRVNHPVMYAAENWEADTDHPQGVRPQVEKAFAELVATLNASPMKSRAETIDKGKVDGYWSRIIERGARAFETYVIANLANKGQNNDYLANVRSLEDFKRSEDRYPYLTPDEQQPVNDAFDKLFSTLETRETDAGVVLYSRDVLADPSTVPVAENEAPRGMTVERAHQVADAFIAAYNGNVPLNIRVVTDQTEAYGAAGSVDRIGRIKGAYHPASEAVVLVAGNVDNVADAERTLRHEILGHYGLNTFTPGDKRSILDAIKASRTWPGLKDTWADVSRRYADKSADVQAEEVFAHIAEETRGPAKVLLDRVMALINKALRAVGLIKAPATKSELREMVQRITGQIRDGQRQQQNFPESDSGLFAPKADAAAFKKWFGDSKVVDENGEPLVVYHGTNADFTEFSASELGTATGAPSARMGFFFASNPAVASSYAEHQEAYQTGIIGALNRWTKGGYERFNESVLRLTKNESAHLTGGNVMPVYLSLKDPLVVDQKGERFREETYFNILERARKNGNDGVIIRNTFDEGFEEGGDRLTDVYVTFRSEQIKSAIGNRGTFDPEDPNILFRRTDSTGFAIPDETLVSAGIRKIADKFKVLKDLQANIRKAGGTIDETADAYMAEELFHGKAENDLRQMRETFVEPLAQKMAQFGISQKDLDQYLYAKHAPERNAHIASINPDMPDGGSGMTNAEAAAILQEKSGKRAQYEQLAKIVYDMTAARRDTIRGAGLEGEDMVDAWESKYQFYVPLKGWAENEQQEGLPSAGKGFNIGGKESKRAMGRGSEAASPSSYVVQDLTETLIRKRKNEVGNAFLKLVEANPNKGYWQVFTDDKPETDRRIIKRADGSEEVVERPIPMAMLQDRYFTTKRNGQTFYIKLEDERLMKAMKNIGPETNNFLIRSLASINRVLSALNTSYNPEFVVGNFSRDIQTAILNLSAEQSRDDGKIQGERIVKQTLKDVPKAMRAVYRGLRGKTPENAEWARWFDEFREAGAKTGYFDMKDIDGQAKDVERLVAIASGGWKGGFMKWIQASTELVEDINGAVENAVRLSAYVNARKAGISQQRAASLAKNMTVNFNRRGEMGTTLNALYMFANASIQGTMNFARTMVGLKGEKGDPVWSRLNTAQKIAAGMMGGAYMLAMANRMAAGDDDDGENWYDKVPGYVKERNIVIMKSLLGGEADGSYWKIPLPYGYNVFHVFGTGVEATTNGDTPITQAATDIGLAALGSFSPIGFQDSSSFTGLAMKNLTPTIGKPLVDVALNENFMGSSIYNENFPFGTPKPDSSLSRRSTPAGYKAIAEFLNDVSGGSQWRSGAIDINPDVMRYFVDYALGGAGKFGLSKLPDNALRLSQGVELEPHRTLFLSRVAGKVLPYEDQDKFYRRRDEIGQIESEFKALAGRERMDFYQVHKPKLALKGMIKATEKRLKVLRRQRDAIYQMNLAPAEQDNRLKEVEVRMKAAVDGFNRAYRESDQR